MRFNLLNAPKYLRKVRRTSIRAYFFCDQILIRQLEHLGCHRKDVLHVVAGLGWSLNEVGDFEFALELFRLFCWHFSGRLSVFHVANQNYDNVRIAILFSFSNPHLQVKERVHSCNIVAETDTGRTFVKDPCDLFEGLLDSRVPNLQLKHVWLKFYG